MLSISFIICIYMYTNIHIFVYHILQIYIHKYRLDIKLHNVSNHWLLMVNYVS